MSDFKKSFSNILNEMTCSICVEYFITPTSLNCSHVFCLHCLEQWKLQSLQCPNCRAKITSQNHVLAMENMINEVLLKVQTDSEMAERRRLVESRQKEQRPQNETNRQASSIDRIHLVDANFEFDDFINEEDFSDDSSILSLTSDTVERFLNNSFESDISTQDSFLPDSTVSSQASTITLHINSDLDDFDETGSSMSFETVSSTIIDCEDEEIEHNRYTAEQSDLFGDSSDENMEDDLSVNSDESSVSDDAHSEDASSEIDDRSEEDYQITEDSLSDQSISEDYSQDNSASSSSEEEEDWY